MQAVISLVAMLAVSLGGLDFKLNNVVPALDEDDDYRPRFERPSSLPVVVEPFTNHVKGKIPKAPEGEINSISVDEAGLVVIVADEAAYALNGEAWAKLDAWQKPEAQYADLDPDAVVSVDGVTWIGTHRGLFRAEGANEPVRHEYYGVDGPLSSRVKALAVDSKGTLWVGTPMGLSLRTPDGQWSHIKGAEGLPCEDVTALAIDKQDRVWIGTKHGAAQYRPAAEGRKWFYRAGPRYLPDDHVNAIAVSPDDKTAWFATNKGVGRIDEVTTTLLEKAQSIEKRVNERHRRFGMVASCALDDAENPTSYFIEDNDNDGLWTSYHVAAMSLCYGATGDEAAKKSAMESMHAMYMLQNVSGTPGLVARSVVTVEEGQKKSQQWRPAPDGKFYWKSDTSSDEIDGHYLAFYTYWEHIARHDIVERELCIKQVRAVTDYIVDNNYQLIDWTGKRTSWGFWNPENLNENPMHYVENGLNSLQILSFLNTAFYITGDQKYRDHFEHLVNEHGYLSNLLLQKKVFPDEHNHSDDQLGYVAWYPILQTERDPQVREALQRAVRRHYIIVQDEKPSFYAFVTATIDPESVDFYGAVDNLRELPEDRREWRMDNSHRSDVVFHPKVDRFEKRQLLTLLPADERDFNKWNRNPYLTAEGGDGRVEDDGSAYLLPYWMGRFHGFIAEK